VPAAWPDDREHCGTPLQDTVLHDDGATESCLLPVDPRLSYVSLEAPVRYPSQVCVPAGSGPVQSCRGRAPDGRAAAVVRDDADGAEAYVVSPDPALVERIASSAQVVTSDAGCEVHPHVLGPAAPDGTPLVPVGATSATVCRWSGGVLARTAVLQGTQLATFSSAAQRLRPGLGTAPVANGNPAPGDPRCAEEAGRALRVRLHYPERPDDDVWLRLTGCGPVIGFDDGTSTALPTDEAVGPLVTAVGFDTGWASPGSLTPSH
jgi:hypothetical protein